MINDKEDELEPDELKKSLVDIFEALSMAEKKETMSTFGESINKIKNSNEKLENPEVFSHCINYKLRLGVNLLAESVRKQGTCEGFGGSAKANFIYTNYDFLENHIEKLCSLKEGPGCSVDKARYLLKEYLGYIITGKTPEFTPTKGTWWMPKFGTGELWINYCNSVYQMYYGNVKSFLEAYNNLLSCEIKKFEYVKHTWFIEYINGEKFEIATTWEKAVACPLEQDGDYYIISKQYVGTNETEPYVIKDEVLSFCYRNAVKIHKNKVKRIFYEDEKVIY